MHFTRHFQDALYFHIVFFAFQYGIVELGSPELGGVKQTKASILVCLTPIHFISRKILIVPAWHIPMSVEGVLVPEEEREGYAWLEERERPKGIAVVRAKYRGPLFVEK